MDGKRAVTVARQTYRAHGRDRPTSFGLPGRYTFTSQYSHMDDPTRRVEPVETTAGREGFGLMFYQARWYDPGLGRMAQADSIVPGGVQGLDRYAAMFNNPIKYNDPSGHTSACAGSNGDPECRGGGTGSSGGGDVPPSTGETALRLTKYGKDVKELYDLFLSTPGYWQELIAAGDDPFTLFLAILLSKESGPLWQNIKGWGKGGDNDPQKWFSDASNHWLWGWVEDHYHVTFGSLSPEGRINAVFNLLGRMESVEGVINASKGVLKDKKTPDSQYSKLSPSDRLILAMQSSDYHSDLYSIASTALSNPVTGYWTWGNAQNVNEIPSDAVYRHDNFYILSRYAN